MRKSHGETLTPKDLQHIVSLREQGLTHKQIAQRMRITEAYVGRILAKMAGVSA